MIGNKSIIKIRYEKEEKEAATCKHFKFIDSFKEIGALYGKSLLDIDLLNAALWMSA